MAGDFATVVIDPPWEYPDGFKGQPPPYPTMPLDEIAALPIPSVLRREGYLFLWTTDRYLDAAHDILRGWGCTKRQTLVWTKPPQGVGLGGMFATTTEFCLVGQRIGPNTRAHGRRTKGIRVDRSHFDWPRGAHSEKPDGFYDLLESVALGPYLDVFARRERPGWTCIGNEIDGRDIREALAREAA